MSAILLLVIPVMKEGFSIVIPLSVAAFLLLPYVSRCLAETVSLSNASSATSQPPQAGAPPKKQNTDEWNGTINFFGKIVDDTGAPVSGVIVEFSVRSWPFYRRHPFGEPKFTYGKVITDKDGNFAVKGKKGDTFTVQSLSKTGYLQIFSRYQSFGVEEANATAEQSPGVFGVARENVALAERLESFRFTVILPANGDPVFLDLEHSRSHVPESEADMKVTFEQGAASGSTRRPFDWKVRFQMVDGAIRVPTEQMHAHGQMHALEYMQNAMIQAPEAGYSRSFTVSASLTDPNWDRMHTMFYVKMKDGKQFGKVYAAVSPRSAGEGALLMIEGMFNPLGSRNLQRRTNPHMKIP
ncbi:MAG TPA: hypothetical protein VF773_03160 [Verrucomicrobiae bacterium]